MRSDVHMSNTLERVAQVVSDRLGIEAEAVKPESSFRDDLGADSLDVVELIMELEDEFDIEIGDDDAEKLSTVGDVVKYIDSL